MAQAPDARPSSPASNVRGRTKAVLPIYRWTVAMVVVAATLLATLLVWGPEMDFPTKVSQRTSTDGSVTLDRTARDVASDAIDDAVGWMTKEGAWLFDGLSTVVTHALVNIERALKWTPWPVVVVGLAFLSFAVGRWRLFIFTSLALLFVGFMGLWENTMDTVALMIVAVAIAVSVGLPLGVLGARSQIVDNLMRPVLDGMQTMPSFVYLLPGILFFGLGKPAGIFATIVYAIPPVIRLTNLGIRQVSTRDSRGGPGVRVVAMADPDQSPDSHGPAHDHGRYQSNDHDGLSNGDHRQPRGSRRARRQRQPRPAEERTGERPDRRARHRVPGHHHRPLDPGGGRPKE